MEVIMLNRIYRLHPAVFLFALILFMPALSRAAADELMGGITFVGEREGVCVLIEGECMEESIYFKLDTCDENQEIKTQFKDKTPFTLLVPKGQQRLVIMKEGEKVISDTITISPERVLEYQLP